MDKETLKEEVKAYWEDNVCEAIYTDQPEYTKEYFEEIENFRYWVTPEVLGFAQFTRFRDKKILEIGVGAGTDFLQWVRAGAEAYGIDLTEAAVEHTKARLKLYGLKAKKLSVGDAEKLPYEDNTFDLVYSWGVLHATPDTKKALHEAVRVTKPNGRIKIMVYNRWGILMLFKWLEVNFLKRKFPKSLTWCLYNDVESKGMKGYTYNEIRRILSSYPVKIVSLEGRVNKRDLLQVQPKPFNALPFRAFAYLLACLMGFNRAGFFMTIELTKNEK